MAGKSRIIYWSSMIFLILFFHMTQTIFSNVICVFFKAAYCFLNSGNNDYGINFVIQTRTFPNLESNLKLGVLE